MLVHLSISIPTTRESAPTVKISEAQSPVIKKPHKDLALNYWITPSPVGRILLVGSPKGLQVLQFQDGAHPLTIQQTWIKACEPFRAVLEQLKEYFHGSRTRFQIRLNLQGTLFQRQVWKALQGIPYGRTVSYGEIANQVGNPNASRAVGAANGQNPVSIIVPCHRVIGANGQLVGYGGGLPIKTALLELEQPKSRKKRSSVTDS